MTKFCTSCGAERKDGLPFCTVCGARQEPEQQPAQTPQSAAFPQRTAAPQQPRPQNRPVYRQPPAPRPTSAQPSRSTTSTVRAPQVGSAPMSTGSYLGTLLLLSIPLVGLVLALVWAFGGGRNLNRRNLTRAYLILMVVVLVISLILGLVVRGIVKSALKEAGLGDEVLDSLGGLGTMAAMGALSDNSDAEGAGSALEGLGALAALDALNDAGETGSNSDDLEALEALAEVMEGMEGLTGEESGASGLSELVGDVQDIHAEASAKNDGWPASLRPYPGGEPKAVETYRTEISNTTREEMLAWIENLKGDGFAFQDFYDFGMSEEDMLGMNGWWATDGKVYLSVSYYDGVVTVDHMNELPNLESLLG